MELKEEQYCPECNDILDNQYGFYKNVNVWICKNCHIPLINPSYPDDTIWFCDSCNAILNNQDMWDPYYRGSYKCSECGCVNSIDQNNEIGYERKLLE